MVRIWRSRAVFFTDNDLTDRTVPLLSPTSATLSKPPCVSATFSAFLPREITLSYHVHPPMYSFCGMSRGLVGLRAPSFGQMACPHVPQYGTSFLHDLHGRVSLSVCVSCFGQRVELMMARCLLVSMSRHLNPLLFSRYELRFA